MVPYALQHQMTSVLTSDASSDGNSPATRSLDAEYVQRSDNNNNNNNNNEEEEFVDQQLFFVTSYSDFDKLAHGPRGSIGKHTLRVYRFLPDGSLVLLHIAGEGDRVVNPAFSRFHPR